MARLMRQRIRIGLGLLALMWAWPAMAEPTPYQPHVGDTLRYALSNGDTATTRVVRIHSEADRTYAMVERVLQHEGSKETRRVTLVRSKEGIALGMPEVEGSGDEKSPLVCYLSQARINDTWTAQKGSYRDAEGDSTEYRVYARLEAIETLKVRAGTFRNCHRIAYRSVMAGSEASAYTLVVWFKPEVGIIKTRTLRGSEATETELVSYALASFTADAP